MKKFISTSTGGAPINSEDLKDVFNSEIWDAMQALLSPYDSDTEGIIVSGCVISGGGPYNITTGIVYLDGEFRRLPAQTSVTLPKYIASKATVNDSRTFADGLTHPVVATKDAELVASAPGTQYVAITTTTDPDNRRLKNISTIANDLVTNTSYQPLSAAQGVALQASKANKTQPAWTDITLVNGWTNVSDSPISPKAQYRTDEFGIVHLRGKINGVSASSDVFTSTLPQPDYDGAHVIISVFNASSAEDFRRIAFSDTGGTSSAQINGHATATNCYLFGVSYHLRTTWPIV